ncbi:SUMF1/EgtB/PvdO family nonheme iron enzyme [candidate division WOR-3 bacterium]|uniref:SUMF1/EgtB/PvdO family nonheme iron enzyme n=1 Tax=candidate division WOR-3 bacterium TaxID=2052148 RepID=A0A9D5QE81_UNCW3|nr:SUMF1/EgtB/PvdO family nonheme iron enzyme [candidate division WOR-3 bacterium]MBD3364785.1 SUMF1/EgtB/PvdO family nonheme iron enzyme [candidate division WOR-3 bacterium]
MKRFWIAIVSVAILLISCEGLTPPDLTGKGFLSINTKPTGCEVYVNGTKMEDTTNCVVDSVPKGEELIVRLAKGEYLDWTDTVTIEDSDTLLIDKRFSANLCVTSDPQGAEIWLDSVNTGQITNYTLTDILVGSHDLRLVKDGYDDWENKVIVGLSKVDTVQAELQTHITQIEWIHVPAGTFMMGSPPWDEDAYENEMPQHSVYLDGYYISKYEITNAQFCEFLNEEGNLYQGFKCIGIDDKWGLCQIYEQDGQYYVESGKDNYPAICVTWYGAKAFSEWLDGRLPTEAEWEKAARGEDKRKYPWGNDEPSIQLAKYDHGDSTQVNTVPVGYYPDGISAYGCFDMAGNVIEWVNDWYDYDYYEISPDSNPQGPDEGSMKVIRGGGWWSWPDELRCSYRYWAYTYSEFVDVGFRPVKDE